MPVSESAKKALRRDRRRAVVNKRIRRRLKEVLKKTRANPTKKMLNQAVIALDRAAKNRVIHPNKAARLKSRLVKLTKKAKKSKKTTS